MKDDDTWLYEISSKRKAIDLNLDEVWRYLDADNSRLVMDMLKIISSEYSQVFAVTHKEELKEMLPKCIEIYKNGEHSEVRYL